MEKSIVERFAEIFGGHQSAYGVYSGISDEPSREDGKKLGRIRKTVKAPVVLALYEKHLAGTDGLGIIPIREDNCSRFGAIDIDVYADLDHIEIAQRLRSLKLPLIVCRSKSGGAHIYLFAKEPVAAAKMVARLKEVAALLGHGSAEIFPKQVELSGNKDDAGSWINLPYFGDIQGRRFGFNAETGDPLDVEDFLEYANKFAQPAAWFDRSVTTSADMPQGPPCLQHLIQIGAPQGTRNKTLYNLGIYAKKIDPENWGQLLEEYNRKYLNPPLDSDEVVTIKKSLSRKDYQYTCNDQPLTAYCNSGVCRGRKYGVGSNGQDRIEFGHIRKLCTADPLYFWDINGRPVTLTAEELNDARRFRLACLKQLNIAPVVGKESDWLAILNEHLKGLDEIHVPPDATPEGQFAALLETYCTSRAQAMTKDEMILGKPWTEEGFTYFCLPYLKKFTDRNGFKDMRQNETVAAIRKLGAISKEIKIKGKSVRCWAIKEFDKAPDQLDMPKSVTDEEKGF
jgi:Primase C terminal 1 (PriCT-1)